MSSLYQKRGIFYLSVNYAGIKKTISTRTRNQQTASQLKPNLERQLLLDLLNDNKSKNTPFNKLVKLYLKEDHGWRPSTLDIYQRMLNGYIKKGFAKNLTTRSMMVRSINACNRWGFKNKLIPEFKKLNGGNEWNSRQRIIKPDELDLLFREVRPEKFKRFLKLVYYTGARVGEIRTLKTDQIYIDYIEVNGKSGLRIIKLNDQAKSILNSMEDLWDYTANYIELTWSRNRKRLSLKNIRMHDLRRTFGYNLIKQGKPIYKVSKLLGHSSVTVTERHYAPLMTTEIEDFTL
jgi:integrase